MDFNDIDWADSDCLITEHFNVGEMLYLHLWGRLANDSDGLNDQIKQNLYTLCNKLEVVRAFLTDKPFNINSGYRPPKYSPLVGGFGVDVHTMGMAVDFTVSSITCPEVKSLILPELELWKLRLEDNGPSGSWIHLDIHSVINKRFFKP